MKVPNLVNLTRSRAAHLLQSGSTQTHLPMNPVAADVSPLHLNSPASQSRLTSAATVQGCKARTLRVGRNLTPLNFGRAAALALLAALLALWAAPAARAYTWDITSGDNPTITDGSGNWNTTGGNLVWNNNANPNVIWSQTSATVGTQAAVFGSGTDGTVDQWTVTLAAGMAATSLTFNNTGYKITGSTLALASAASGANNGSMTVAAGKTATINSTLRYIHNQAAAVTVNSGSTLNLGGGTTASFNPQFAFSGAGTINLTAGTFTQNVGNMGNAVINLTGGTHAITPGNNAGANIGNNAGQNINYTVSGAGTLTVNNNTSSGTGTGNSWLRLGLGDTTSYEAKLTVQTGGTVTIGSGKYGELQISGATTSNGRFDVQGGNVTIANGVPAANKIYFFKNGSTAGYSATMTQSGGTVTANGIQIGDATGTFDNTTSLATLQLSGGNLYVGAEGITIGSAAVSQPYAIKLQGGTLGADQNWSSSLDMKLGTATIQAANSGGTARNITLSGVLSDDSGAGTLTKTGNGTLTLSGAGDNTFTGATLVSAGTLNLGKVNAVNSSSSVTVANGGTLALSASSSTVSKLIVAGGGALSFNVAGGYSLTVNGTDGVTNSGAASSVTLNITGSAPANGTYTLIGYSGSLQGSGFSAYTLGTTPAGKDYILNDSGSAVQLIVSSPYLWTGAESTEWSTAAIGGSQNWTTGGSPADYTDGQGVIFDGTATGYTVDLSVADVTPASVSFINNNTSDYTLQGSKAIAGSTSLTKNGGNTLTILNANTYTGGSTLGTGGANVGAVGIGNDSALGSGKITALGAQLRAINAARTLTNAIDIDAGALRFGGDDNDLTLSGPATVVGGGREIGMYSAGRTLTMAGGVDLNGFFLSLNATPGDVPKGTIVFSAPITGSGNFTLLANFTNATATLTAANTYNGTTLITGGTLQLGDGTSGNDGTIANTSSLQNNDKLVYNRHGTSTYSGVISGSGSVTKNGPGIQILTGTNTYSGTTTVNGGTLRMVNGALTKNRNYGAIASGATLEFQNSSGNFIEVEGITLTGNGTFKKTGTDEQRVFSGITTVGMGSGGLFHVAEGNFQFGGATPADWTANLSDFQVDTGASFDARATGLVIDALLGGGTLRIGTKASSPSPIALTLGADGGSGTFSGSIVDVTSQGGNTDFSLVKTGTGTQTLSGANTYSGDTTVSAGTLALSGSGSIASTPSITVAGGATFDVSGLSSPPFALGASQTLTNSGATTANLAGDVSTGSGTVGLSFASGTPSFTAAGTLTLAAGTTLAVKNTGAELGHGSHKLIAKTGSGTVTGTLPSSYSVSGGGAASPNYLWLSGGELYLAVNNAPVAVNVTNSVAQGGSVTIPFDLGKYKLATDADSDSLTIISVSASLGNVGTDGSSINYTNTSGSAGTYDSLSFTVVDNYGGTNSAAVAVLITSATGANLVSATAGDGNAYLSYAGIPGYNYALDKATSITPPIMWVPQVTNTANGSGQLNYTNLLSTWPTNDFFRTRYVP